MSELNRKQEYTNLTPNLVATGTSFITSQEIQILAGDFEELPLAKRKVKSIPNAVECQIANCRPFHSGSRPHHINPMLQHLCSCVHIQRASECKKPTGIYVTDNQSIGGPSQSQFLTGCSHSWPKRLVKSGPQHIYPVFHRSCRNLVEMLPFNKPCYRYQPNLATLYQQEA